jgi:two-component system response regulator PilR (NtrC family)
MGSKALMRLVGQSASMCAVKDRILKVASSMAPVMITGESGTGKELVAYAIHANSHRASGPWVAVNCSAIPENLLEAEFFGARKGAYTGAHQDRDGFFQAARGGTLFLDEIGDLPLAMQSKLLRAIQERRIRPLGSSQEETVDVRILSATHKNLTQEVQAGLFRQDLFYRLNVIDVAIAPLRERRADLAALCTALLKRIAEESGMPPLPMPSSMLDQLAELPMPGNVRELENLLHRAVALYDGQELQLDASKPQEKPGQARATETPESAATAFMPDDLQRYLDEKERRILIQALEKTNFNRTAAAHLLGLSLRQIRYRIERLQIETPNPSDAIDDPI